MSRLHEAEGEVERLRSEIEALENSAAQTEAAIDSLLVTMRSGTRGVGLGKSIRIEDDYDRIPDTKPRNSSRPAPPQRNSGSVTYLNQNRVPAKSHNIEPISHRFADRTITQACTLLLREANKSLHVNELYNLLVAGGMEFKGKNPTISIAVSLNRNRRFRKVGPGTFDLMMRDASGNRAAS
ncbi:MAG: winged helix-turn-helix domain-containing protein [Acidobacteria bacterium]|nr:winged helix-turn-helix domain-containing protein [Acidobacteriota bacterium]